MTFTQPSGPPTAEKPNHAAAGAGVLWIASALFTGYLALLQLGYGSVPGTDLRALGVWNGLAALLTAYFGVRCLSNPTRRFLNIMVFWAILDVGLGVVQIAGGATHWAYLGSVASAAIAGVLCFTARDVAPGWAVVPVAGPNVTTPAVETKRQRVTPLQFIAGLIILAAILGATVLLIEGRLPATAGAPPANVPPVGQIWFSSSFDPTTFAVSGVTTTATVGSTVALVARLPRSVSTGDVNMRVSLDGTVILNQNMAVRGSGDLFGTTVGPFLAAGTYQYDLVDAAEDVLANGTLTVTGT